MTNKVALIVAVVLGVLSILGIRTYVEKIKGQYEAQAALVDIPVAARDLRNGEFIQKGDVAKKLFPRAVLEGLGDTRYNDVEELLGLKVIVPNIKANQIFQQYHFRMGTGNTKRLVVGPNFRAVTLPVNPTNSHAGMLRPDDLVDVVVTIEFKDLLPNVGGVAKSDNKLKLTTTLLKKVRILATDAITDRESSLTDYSTITLQLTPSDANRLHHALDHGSPFHLMKLDETSSPSAGYDVVFADRLFKELEAEITRFFKGQ